MQRQLFAILIATIWSVLSEFFRNELLFKHVWAHHFQSLGLTFPSAPLNGAIWGLWSLVFVVGLRIILTRFSLVSGALLAWLMGFVLMWLVTGNLLVLPLTLLVYAIPLSLFEVFVAAWLLVTLTRQEK
jgi:hypothetical protein